ncbi:MAG: hypothetical protein NT179_02405 [Nitrospirae bacterium]|nr:hypothetical protein [Nitrospirota bacterium]
MHVISSKIHDLKLRHARTKQKRAALHMLTLSGVIRPSHSELRYEAPLARMTALDSESTSLQHSQTLAIPLPLWEQDLTTSLTTTWHYIGNLSSSLVQLAKKPIVLQWNKQVDA